MGYQVGDMVVYPRHGAARVEEISERTVKGVTRQYLRLVVLSSDGLEINVPVDNVKKVGVRDIVGAKEVAKDEHGLSAGEKRMLARARSILISEIALSEKIDETQAERLLNVNLGYANPLPGDEEHHTHAPEEAAADTLRLLAEKSKKAKKK